MHVTLRRAIALVKMIGGIVGIPVTSWYLSGLGATWYSLLVSSAFIGLCDLSFAACWMLWKNHARGVVSPILVHALQ